MNSIRHVVLMCNCSHQTNVEQIVNTNNYYHRGHRLSVYKQHTLVTIILY